MEKKQGMVLEKFGIDPESIIRLDGRYWMTPRQLGTALGYNNPSKSIRNLIERHSKELQPFIKGGIKLMSPGGEQETTIIDTDGQYTIAMLANTQKAMKFRRIVVGMLKALERREFVHVSQVAAWQSQVMQQLLEWKEDLVDLHVTRLVENSSAMTMKKYRELIRYRKLGLTQRETAKLLDVSRDMVQAVERIPRKFECKCTPMLCPGLMSAAGALQ